MSANEFSTTPYHSRLKMCMEQSRTATVERKHGEPVKGEVFSVNPTECVIWTADKENVNIAIDNISGVRNK